MEFHPSKIPISKIFDVKDEKQASDVAHEMVMIGFESEEKGFKVLMPKEDQKTAKRIGYTVTTTVTYALRKTNQERDVRYWTYIEKKEHLTEGIDHDRFAIVFVSSRVLERLDFSW
tara:strand:- start:386 stop:733 length:348 start_codon:yes stop_codon:yes gene_type:complete